MTDPEDNPREETPDEVGGEAGSQAMDAALRSSFVILKCVIAVLVVFLLFSNTKTVEDKQEGAIVLRFGKSRTPADQVWDSGLRLAWPYPIEEVKMLDASRPVSTEFAWTSDPAKNRAAIEEAEVDPDAKPRIDAGDPTQGYLLTKDNKALHLKATLAYEITDPDQFAFGFHDVKQGEKEVPGVEIILKAILESALTHAARERTLEEILKPDRIDKTSGDSTPFDLKVEKRVKRLMARYKLGVVLQGNITISLGDQDQQAIPYYARDSWLAYINPDIGIIEKAREQAQSITNRINELADIKREAENERKAMIDSLQSITNQFATILATHKTPAARRRQMDELYLETIKRIAQDPNVTIWLVPSGTASQPTRIRLQINQPKAKSSDN